MKRIHLSRRSTVLISCAAALALPLSACSDDQSARNAENAERAAQAEDARQAEAARAEEARQKERGTMESMQQRAGDMMDRAGDAAGNLRIHIALETKLATSDQLSALAINTDVKDGVAHLKGEVRTDTERGLAELIAANTPGVSSVRNELEVGND